MSSYLPPTHRNRIYHKNRLGFSLVELVIAISLLGILGAVFMNLFVTTLRVSDNNEFKIVSSGVANEKIEIARNLPYDDVGTTTGIPNGVLSPSETVNVGGEDYTVVTRVRYIDDPYDDVAPTDLLNTDYKQVEVRVTNTSRGEATEVVMVSNIVPNGLETDVGGGTLRVQVFDPSEVGSTPVPGATVQIEAPDVTPAVSLTATTDDGGWVTFPGAPAGIAAYKIVVSKSGYNSTQTYDVDAINNPNPDPSHLNIEDGVVTTEYFKISRLSDELTVAAVQPDPSGTTICYEGETQFIDNDAVNSYLNTAPPLTLSMGPAESTNIIRNGFISDVNGEFSIEKSLPGANLEGVRMHGMAVVEARDYSSTSEPSWSAGWNTDIEWGSNDETIGGLLSNNYTVPVKADFGGSVSDTIINGHIFEATHPSLATGNTVALSTTSGTNWAISSPATADVYEDDNGTPNPDTVEVVSIAESEITSLSPNVWLDATDVNADGSNFTDDADVVTWKDKSGNGNDFAQISSGLSPTYDQNGLNDLPAVRIDNTQRGLRVVNPVTGSPTDLSVFMVVKQDDTGTDPNGTYMLDVNSEHRFRLNNGDTDRGMYMLNDWYMSFITHSQQADQVSWLFEDTASPESTVRRNGGEIDTDNNFSQLSLADNLTLGSRYETDDADDFSGNISEVLLFDSKLSDADRDKVECYLADKWNLVTSTDCSPYSVTVDVEANDLIEGYADGDFNINVSGLLANEYYYMYLPHYEFYGRSGNYVPNDGGSTLNWAPDPGEDRILRYGFQADGSGNFTMGKSGGAGSLALDGFFVVKAANSSDPNYPAWEADWNSSLAWAGDDSAIESILQAPYTVPVKIDFGNSSSLATVNGHTFEASHPALPDDTTNGTLCDATGANWSIEGCTLVDNVFSGHDGLPDSDGINYNNVPLDIASLNPSAWLDGSDASSIIKADRLGFSNDTDDFGPNSYRRVYTHSSDTGNGGYGFSYPDSVDFGSQSSTNFGYQQNNNRATLPHTHVFIRPEVDTGSHNNNGSSSGSPGDSCWQIKQDHSGSSDGNYWVQTPAMSSAMEVYCDMDFEGGGWVVVGYGREDWDWDNDGQRTGDYLDHSIFSTSSFDVVRLSKTTIDELMNNRELHDDDGLWLRRAANSSATEGDEDEWQDVRWEGYMQDGWSWDFRNNAMVIQNMTVDDSDLGSGDSYSAGGSSDVVRWDSQIGNASNYLLVNGNGPTVTTATQNGLDAVNFPGNTVMQSVVDTQMTGTDATVMMVAQANTSSNSWARLFSIRNGLSGRDYNSWSYVIMMIRYSNQDDLAIYRKQTRSLKSNFYNNNWHIALSEVYLQGNRIENTTYVDGTQGSQNSHNNRSMNADRILLGGAYSNGFGSYHNGHVGELVFFDRKLSTSEQEQLTCEFSTKWDIAVSTDCSGYGGSTEENQMNNLATGLAHGVFDIEVTGLDANSDYFMYLPHYGTTGETGIYSPSDAGSDLTWTNTAGQERIVRYGFTSDGSGNFTMSKTGNTPGLGLHGVFVVKAAAVASSTAPEYVAGWDSTQIWGEDDVELKNLLQENFTVPVKVDFGNNGNSTSVNNHVFEDSHSGIADNVWTTTLCDASGTNWNISNCAGNENITSSANDLPGGTQANHLATGASYQNYTVNITGLTPFQEYYYYGFPYSDNEFDRTNDFVPSGAQAYLGACVGDDTFVEPQTPIEGLEFIIQGSKTIGTTNEGFDIFKFSQSATTDAEGEHAFNNLEADSYSILVDEPTESFTIAGFDTILPYSVEPNLESSISMKLVPYVTNSALITVANGSNDPIPGASVRVYGSGYDNSLYVDSTGHVFFGDVPNSGNYTVEISKTGYSTLTTTITISGNAKSHFVLSASS